MWKIKKVQSIHILATQEKSSTSLYTTDNHVQIVILSLSKCFNNLIYINIISITNKIGFSQIVFFFIV
jgi:hypothetical protein